MSKDDDSCSVTFLIFLPPSPSSVLHTSLRSARANTHVLYSTAAVRGALCMLAAAGSR
eukprot:COSAG01_NODE_7196_length_3308_cov_16.219071_2_plen_58_part_00